MSSVVVRPMRSDDVATASEISKTAGTRFLTIEEPRIAARSEDPPFSANELLMYVDAHRAWVVLDRDDVVGFAVIDVLDGAAHIEELDVAVGAGDRGHGTRLLNEVIAWARHNALAGITLTTFRDVPWNAPWYARRGFRALTDDELTPQLRERRDHEHAQGLDAELRVVMRYDPVRPS